MNTKQLSIFATIPFLLLQIIFATTIVVVVSNIISVISEQKAMAEGLTNTKQSLANATSINLNAAREQYLSVWNHTSFHSQFDTFVNSAQGYGIYQDHKSNVFKPGEDIILYSEPVGFSHVPVIVNNTKLYLINMTASIILSDKQGNVLFGKENIPILNVISHVQNTELYARIRLGQSSPFPSGQYVVTYILNDVPSEKSFKIVKDITVL